MKTKTGGIYYILYTYSDISYFLFYAFFFCFKLGWLTLGFAMIAELGLYNGIGSQIGMSEAVRA